MSALNNHFGKIAAFNFLSAVVLGAIGGHNYTWPEKRKERFMKAQVYHVINGVGMFMGSFAVKVWARYMVLSLFGLGIGMFVAPLYWMALKDDDDFVLKKLMPVGGISTMLGFASLIFLL